MITSSSMPLAATPYDELPYRSFPIEWTAPERLALTSLLHGGPRQRLDEYQVLELGCGDGTNLVPLAYYRTGGTFVGVDAAASQIAVANEKRALLKLDNLSFVTADFASAADCVTGQFDYIVGHGVFSWISHTNRDALLALCSERLRPGGLLYLNYNARPGWNMRGLVRGFLLMQTAKTGGLAARTELARAIAARLAEELADAEHPYSRLLGNEFRFVGQHHQSHTAHEYLSDYNYAYARDEFIDLMARYGFAYVADADFAYVSGRVHEALSPTLARLELDPDTADQTADLLCYRQLLSPILTTAGFVRRATTSAELSTLVMASSLDERETPRDGMSTFQHSSGFEVEVRSNAIATALRVSRALWPEGCRLDTLFSDVGEVIEDLTLLHRRGMIELRLMQPSSNDRNSEPLHDVERRFGGGATTRNHIRSTLADARQ